MVFCGARVAGWGGFAASLFGVSHPLCTTGRQPAAYRFDGGQTARGINTSLGCRILLPVCDLLVVVGAALFTLAEVIHRFGLGACFVIPRWENRT